MKHISTYWRFITIIISTVRSTGHGRPVVSGTAKIGLHKFSSLYFCFVLEQENVSGVVGGRVDLHSGRTRLVEAIAAQRHNV